MAINVSTLNAYVEEHKLPLIRKAVLDARSAKEMNLMTGVKGTTALNLLDTTVTFGDGSACGWSEAGSSSLSQRNLVPGAIKVNMSFCDKQLLKTWANYEVRVGAGQKVLPFEEDFVAGVLEGVKAKLEKTIWQGVTPTDAFDGLVKTIETDIPSANVYTYASGDSINKKVDAVYAKIPSAAFDKGDVVMFMGKDDYRAYIQSLIANGNLVITNVVNDVAMPESVLIPGTDVRVIPVGGLDGTHKIFASYRENFVYGTDLAGDEEKFEFWYSQDNREFRLAIEFTAGAQVAYPDLIVEGKA